MLNLSSQGRTFLIFVGALDVDASGHEILVGLTALESSDFLRHQAFTDQLQIGRGAARFLLLMERHLTARRLARKLR
ncbi:hypothetical protein HUX88_31750 [Duganella sp. BJB1802]|uniref:hypothetical protein n=1 Tax=Duganella sp. BJB1802 TaxID=2744575 RepID=UPI0015938651|nr:hypothetical protein [Duganella sp. BJB1802]NVD75053.1 hypothetical protein [Duganella sp. BJB1802]